MITEYIHHAMKNAHYEIIPEDNSFYGEIEGFAGVYATGTTLEECRTELIEVLEEWLLFSISKNLKIPVVNGINLQIFEIV